MASYTRWAALASYCILSLVGAFIFVILLSVDRAPLPLQEVAALRSSVSSESKLPWEKMRLSLSAAPAAFVHANGLQDFATNLMQTLASAGILVDVHVESSPPSRLLSLGPCLTPDEAHFSSGSCLESLEGVAGGTLDGAEDALSADSFHLLVVPASGRSALLLDTGTSAILRWHRAPPIATPSEIAVAAAKRLQETWFRELLLERSAPLFEIAPSYVLSFFLVGDCEQRVAWDFAGVVHAPFLHRFLARLSQLFDFEIDSQVVQCGSLGGARRPDNAVIDEATLQADFLRNAGEWPGDTVTRSARWLPPLVRLVAFRPSHALKIVDAGGLPQSSFALQGWGAVAVVGADAEPCGEQSPSGTCADAKGSNHGNSTTAFLTFCEARLVASAWVSNLRSWLTLPPEGPVAATISDDTGKTGTDDLAILAAQPRLDGITQWEQYLVARAVLSLFVRRTAETLENVLALVESLPDVVVREEIGDMVFQATAAARRANSAGDAGKLSEALSAARHALRLALTTSHDDTVVAQMYFSWEFKSAVYLPLMLPIAVPSLVGVFRELRKLRALRKLHRQVAREVTAQDVQ